MKFLLALTTTHKAHWQHKVLEIEKLGLTEISIFPTCLKIDKRKELYGLLEKSKIKNIPLTHLRTDCMPWEIEYLMKQFNCRLFNIHADNLAQGFLDRCKKYRHLIYIENGEHYQINDHFKETLDQSAGLCLDFSHWEDYEVRQDYVNYRNFKKYINNYKVGFAHISVTKDELFSGSDLDGNQSKFYASHFMEKLSEFDYMEDYIQYLPKYSAIEIENSLTDQLKAKKYLEKMLNSATIDAKSFSR